MVLVIGHKFKLEVWENIVKLMAVGEVASFRVKKEVRISFFLPITISVLQDLLEGILTKYLHLFFSAGFQLPICV